MTHYQKLATMTFRLIGALLMLTGVLTVVIYLFPRLIDPYFRDWRLIIPVSVYSLPFFVTGFFLFATSRPLGRWICFDFDKE
jgi:hypothetical protein